MNSALLGVAILIAYSIAAVLVGTSLNARHRANVQWQHIPAWLALTFHGLLLANTFSKSGVYFDFFSSLGLFAWIITALFLLASLKWVLSSMGLLVFPIAGLCAAALGVFADAQRALPTPMSGLLQTHIAISVFAYSLLSLAGLQAILLAVQDKHLHNHRPAGFIRSLPPLQVMEQLMFRMISVGFALLTLSLLSGIIVDHPGFHDQARAGPLDRFQGLLQKLPHVVRHNDDRDVDGRGDGRSGRREDGAHRREYTDHVPGPGAAGRLLFHSE